MDEKNDSSDAVASPFEHGHALPAALLALADRCEREEPSRDLDEAIALALGWKWVGLSPRYWLEPGMDVKAFQAKPNLLDPRVHLAIPLRFTGSLDAAATLVPTGFGYMLNHYSHELWCGIDYDNQNAEKTGSVGPNLSSSRDGGNRFLPMVICAAALKALSAITAAEGGSHSPNSPVLASKGA